MLRYKTWMKEKPKKATNRVLAVVEQFSLSFDNREAIYSAKIESAVRNTRLFVLAHNG